MPSSPRLEHREAVRYLAIPGAGTGADELRAFADRWFPGAFGAVAARGLTPTGAPFFRFFRFVPGGEFDVEIGVPVGADLALTVAEPQAADADPYVVRELPAGRYAVHVHEGAYNADDEVWAGRDLASSHRRLEDWADEQGIRWATDATGRWASSIEQYLVGPAETAEVDRWRTLIAKLVDDRP